MSKKQESVRHVTRYCVDVYTNHRHTVSTDREERCIPLYIGQKRYTSASTLSIYQVFNMSAAESPCPAVSRMAVYNVSYWSTMPS